MVTHKAESKEVFSNIVKMQYGKQYLKGLFKVTFTLTAELH